MPFIRAFTSGFGLGGWDINWESVSKDPRGWRTIANTLNWLRDYTHTHTHTHTQTHIVHSKVMQQKSLFLARLPETVFMQKGRNEAESQENHDVDILGGCVLLDVF